mmetsp:Transcript_64821/g.128124  ORF Transcript_64821/g.128124 Transcript_64821/m.128124 type:complete len:220 (+) Transcript_64821:1275-1934(+)
MLSSSSMILAAGVCGSFPSGEACDSMRVSSHEWLASWASIAATLALSTEFSIVSLATSLFAAAALGRHALVMLGRSTQHSPVNFSCNSERSAASWSNVAACATRSSASRLTASSYARVVRECAQRSALSSASHALTVARNCCVSRWRARLSASTSATAFLNRDISEVRRPVSTPSTTWPLPRCSSDSSNSATCCVMRCSSSKKLTSGLALPPKSRRGGL